MRIFSCVALLLTLFVGFAYAENTLRSNLAKARPGDFVVTTQNKNYTLLHIHDKSNDTLTLEEITVPSNKIAKTPHTWKDWVEKGSPGHTSWVMYEINTQSGNLNSFFSFTKRSWFDVEQMDHFLSKLLNLELKQIPDSRRKKIGVPPARGAKDMRRMWQPKMVFEGKVVDGVEFGAWRAQWPKDDSPLSNKVIDVFIPKENDRYPIYYPYWLQVAGMVGKARIRIIDSGMGLKSPKDKNWSVAQIQRLN